MAKIREVTVGAGRTFNHPYESYSNLKPHVSVTATLDDNENYQDVVKQLQAEAEGIIEDHKNHILESLHELHDLTEKQAEARRLSATIVALQRKLDRIRLDSKELPSPTEKEISEAEDNQSMPF